MGGPQPPNGAFSALSAVIAPLDALRGGARLRQVVTRAAGDQPLAFDVSVLFSERAWTS
jgi:hypothetical protein